MTRQWQRILLDALEDQQAVGVASTVQTFLGCEPTRSELTSARRAARTLVARGDASAVAVPTGTGNLTALVITKTGVDVDELTAYVAATRKPQATGRLRSTAEQLADIERLVEVAATTARQVNLRGLDHARAHDVAVALADPVAELQRLRRRLVARGE